MSSEINKQIEEKKTFLSWLKKYDNPETKSIITLLVIALTVRILISLLFTNGHPTDLNNFKGWTIGVTKKGIFDFFQPPPQGVWCDYPPGYIYILYFFGSLYSIFDPTLDSWYTRYFSTLVRLPGIISDMVNIYLIYYILRKYIPFSFAISAATIYSIQPGIIFESTIWGQMDSVILSFILLSLLFLIEHKYDLSIFIGGVGCLIKPQGALLLPLLCFVVLYNKGYKKLILGCLYSLIFAIIITVPITRDLLQVFPWLWQHYMEQAGLYPFSSIQTFNLWALTGIWLNDSRLIFGIPHKTWGIILFSLFYISCLLYYIKRSKAPTNDEHSEIKRNEAKYKKFKTELEAEINNINVELEEIRKISSDNEESKIKEINLNKLKLNKEAELEQAKEKFIEINKIHNTAVSKTEAIAIIHVATLILIGFFMLPTRMHERYIFSGISLLALSSALNFRLKNIYYYFSALFLINLFFEFPGNKTDVGAPEFLINLMNSLNSGSMYTENFGLFWYTPLALANIVLFVFLVIKLWKEPMLNIDESNVSTYTKPRDFNEETEPKTKGFFVPAIQKIDRFDWLIILIIALASTLLRLFYLKYPEEMIFDEVYHARAAGEYLRGINPFEWVHPPLAKLLISVGVWGFGLNSFGWRIMPVIFGTFFVPVMYVFGKSLFSKRWLGVLAAVLVNIDGVFFVQSRTAMTNIFATFFQLTAVMFFWLYFQHDYHEEKKRKAYSYLFMSGFFMSLALATRWTSMGAFAFILGSLVWYKLFFDVTIKDLLSGNFKPISDKISLKEIPFLCLVMVSFVLLPALVYIASYIPYMNLNHSVKDIIEMQRGIFTYHKNLRDPHPYYSEWYKWPFMIRPTWYYFRDFKNGAMAGIIALGNPAIWWASLFATAFVLYKGVKEKLSSLLFVGLGFVILYLPWAVSPRIKNFNHYLFEAIPYACLAITFIVGYLWDKGNIKKETTNDDRTFNILAFFSIGILSLSLLLIGILALWTVQWKYPFPIDFLAPYSQKILGSATYIFISLIGIILYTLYENSKFRTLAIVYMGIALGMFIFFYPLYSGYPMFWWYYGLHIWLPTWI